MVGAVSVPVADGKTTEAERKFLRELRGEARQVSPEFQALRDECRV